jgi:hypothetical protein
MPGMSFTATDPLTTKLSRSHRSDAGSTRSTLHTEPRFSPIADLAEARVVAHLSASLEFDASALGEPAQPLASAPRSSAHPLLFMLGPGALSAPEASVERAVAAMDRASLRAGRVAWIAPLHRGYTSSALRALGDAARRVGLRLVLSGDARTLATALATSARCRAVSSAPKPLSSAISSSRSRPPPSTAAPSSVCAA